MPSAKPIPAIMRAALEESHNAIISLIPVEQQCLTVLVGGAASLCHGSKWKTEDLDLAGPPHVISSIFTAILAKQQSGRSQDATSPEVVLEDNSGIAIKTTFGFIIHADLLEFGGGCIDTVYESQPIFHDDSDNKGHIASLADLLRLRVASLACRQSNGDLLDLYWLLEQIVGSRTKMPHISQEDQTDFIFIANEILGEMWRLVFVAVLGEENIVFALQLLGLY